MVEKKITFEKLHLRREILDSLNKKGYENPTEIQEKIIPVVLENRQDIIGVSKTGSGKTGAFGLPILNLLKQEGKEVKVLVLTPTRELALQVSKELNSFSPKRQTRILEVYGGTSINRQIFSLKKGGVDIVVGTPGRVLDLIKRKVLILSKITHFVLDEADEMLNMGFIDDIERIFKNTNEDKKVLLFSATMPQKIKNLSKKYMKNQTIIEIKHSEETKVNIKQEFYILRRQEKLPIISKIIENTKFFYGIIFCQTKRDVNDLTYDLRKKGYKADCIHGDISQAKRERILAQFRKQKINVLVATDVAARGIDINDLTHVINHSVSKEIENYVHRIGRVGRAGKSGIAISFFSSNQKYIIPELEKLANSKFEKGEFYVKFKKDGKSDFKNKIRRNFDEDRGQNFHSRDGKNSKYKEKKQFGNGGRRDKRFSKDDDGEGRNRGFSSSSKRQYGRRRDEDERGDRGFSNGKKSFGNKKKYNDKKNDNFKGKSNFKKNNFRK